MTKSGEIEIIADIIVKRRNLLQEIMKVSQQYLGSLPFFVVSD